MSKCYVLLRQYIEFDEHETIIVKIYSDETKAKAHLNALDAILDNMYAERRARYNSTTIIDKYTALLSDSAFIDKYTALLSDSAFAGPFVRITKFCQPSYRIEECEIE